MVSCKILNVPCRREYRDLALALDIRRIAPFQIELKRVPSSRTISLGNGHGRRLALSLTTLHDRCRCLDISSVPGLHSLPSLATSLGKRKRGQEFAARPLGAVASAPYGSATGLEDK